MEPTSAELSMPSDSSASSSQMNNASQTEIRVEVYLLFYLELFSQINSGIILMIMWVCGPKRFNA